MKLNFLGILISAALSTAAVLPASAATVAVAPQARELRQHAQQRRDAGAGFRDRNPQYVMLSDGSISNATVEKSSGVAAADFAAIDHAHHLKLAPQIVDGAPIRSQKKIAVAVKPRDAAGPLTPRQPVAQPTITAAPLLLV